MRARLALLLLAAVAAASALWWLLRDPPARAGPLTPAAAPTSGVAVDRAQTTATEREPVTDPMHCSIGGRLVDGEARPLAAADVTLLAGDSLLGTFTSGPDGHFVVAPAPATAAALRFDAPGFVSTQLGDLAPEQSPGGHLELGTIVLQPAATYHGRVVAAGRGVRGAEVRVLPPLGEAMIPLVQRAITDDDGWFFFAAAAPPPCHVTARADGFRDASPLALTSPTGELLLELQPMPIVRGRVVSADNAPLAAARVRVRTLERGESLRPVQAPLDQDPTDTLAVAADGTFALPLRTAGPFVLTAIAPDHVAAALGPLADDDTATPRVVVLARGAVVAGTVTWRGEPVAATVALWPADATDGPPRVAQAVARDGRFELAPVPLGHWLLRANADGSGLFTGELDLGATGPQRADIALPDGTRLVGNVLGHATQTAEIVCTHTDGRRVRAVVAGDGAFAVSGLSPGAWRVQVVVHDQTWRSQAAAMLGDLLEPRVTVVAGDVELRADVPTPSRCFGRLVGQLAPTAVGRLVELLPSDELQERVPTGLRRATIGANGAFELDPVLPGTWRVRWDDAAGATHETTIEVVAGAAATCAFD